jgi:Flp pilus assembly protein TadD
VNLPTTSRQNPLPGAVIICLLLAAAVFTVYFPVLHYGFVDYDDDNYFFNNPQVLGGLSWANLGWALTSTDAVNWHPLTWLSLMLDAQFFGKGATAPHVTNVILHAANSVLLYFLFLRWTSSSWRSAAAALLFAIHPMHVESVAWVAERKDVLSGFFGLLALLCYTRHADASKGGKAWGPAYWLTLLFFTCSLLSKPMLVTFPFLLLLLDYWPLGRFGNAECEGHAWCRNEPGEANGSRGRSPHQVRELVIEKIPFILLSVASSVVTFVVQQEGGAVKDLTRVSLLMRVENTFVSYASYLFKLFWPVNLANPYPTMHYWPVPLVIVCAALFVALCLAAFMARTRYPYVFTGWFWFAGMLVPVIGLVQVGLVIMADRYEYFPMVGILMILVMGIGDLSAKFQFPRVAVVCVASVLLFACGLRARNQVSFWQNSEKLFAHALAVTQDNYVASVDLATWYSKSGRTADALNCYYNALHMIPDDPSLLYDAGDGFAKLGYYDEAIKDYRHALQVSPNQPDILNNLGFALAQNHQLPEAAACFQDVLKLKPNSVEAHNNLATILFAQGNYQGAAQEFRAALKLKPDDALMNVNLGDTLVRLGEKSAAIESYQRALQLEPENAQIRARLQALGVAPQN